MKYCINCGKQIEDHAVFCAYCGTKQTEGTATRQTPNTYELPRTEAPAAADGSSFGFSLLGFCIPIVGLILYLVWNDDKPLRAKSAGKGVLVGMIVCAALYALYAVLIGMLMVVGI